MKKIYKAWNILLPKEKKNLTILIFLKIIGMGLEVLGIALIIPLISILLKQETEFFNLDIVGYDIQSISVTWMAVFIIIAYLIKNLSLMFLTWIDTKFAYGVEARLSKSLFKGYLNLPYHFHLTRNASKLVYNATGAVAVFKATLFHVAVLISELFVLLGISIFLIIIEPFGFICASLLIGLFAATYYKMHKKKVTEWGEKTQFHQKSRIKNLMQGLGAVKEIIILGLQNFFTNMYDIHNVEAAKMNRKNDVVNQFPKYILELSGVIGILTILIILKESVDKVEEVIIILGVFAAASFRLMPSANRILNALQGFRYSIAAIDNLGDEFDLINKKAVYTSDKKQKYDFLKFQKFNLFNVNYKYPNTENYILKNISLTLNKGEMLGIFGKTGSGKSTLIDIIAGLLNLEEGEISIDQKKYEQVPIFWQRNIGYVPQNIYLLDDTLKKNIALGVSSENVNSEKIDELISLLDLKTLVNSLPKGIDTEVGERGIRLSGGEKQRVGIARALYNNPQILIFDEATNALDLKTEKLVMESIKKLQAEKIILIISHKKITLDFCNRIVELKNGVLEDKTEK